MGPTEVKYWVGDREGGLQLRRSISGEVYSVNGSTRLGPTVEAARNT